MLAPFGAAKKSIIFREFCSVTFVSGVNGLNPPRPRFERLSGYFVRHNKQVVALQQSFVKVKVSLRALCAVWSFGVTMPSADRDD